MKAILAEKHYYSNELYLHMVAGRMLFPRSEENFVSYLCLGIDDVLSKSMKNGVPKQDAFAGVLSIINSLFPQECIPNTAWDRYQACIRNARFPSQGKGSVDDRTIRGKFAGLLLNLALRERKSLTEAATLIEERWGYGRPAVIEVLGSDPITMTTQNFMQNIWPEYRSSAHLWAAVQDFDLPDSDDEAPWSCRFPFLQLANMVEKGALVVPNPEGGFIRESQAIWPSQFSGWRAFLYKANHILQECAARGNSKGSTKPLLVAAECWEFPLSDTH